MCMTLPNRRAKSRVGAQTRAARRGERTQSSSSSGTTNTNTALRSLTEGNPLSVSVYVGYTSQTGDKEFYASFSRTHSVLKMAGCGLGKKKLMELGFQPMVLGSYTCRPRARQVEGALHRLMEHLPLGERLWRKSDNGARKYDGKWHHRVFIIFSTTALEHPDIQVVH